MHTRRQLDEVMAKEQGSIFLPHSVLVLCTGFHEPVVLRTKNEVLADTDDTTMYRDTKSIALLLSL